MLFPLLTISLPTLITISTLSGAVASGVVIALLLLFLGKKYKKSKRSTLASKFKLEKTINYLAENVKQLNDRLQLSNTNIARKLEAFDNIDNELLENIILSQRAKKQELSEKDKKQAIKVKI